MTEVSGYLVMTSGPPVGWHAEIIAALARRGIDARTEVAGQAAGSSFGRRVAGRLSPSLLERERETPPPVSALAGWPRIRTEALSGPARQGDLGIAFDGVTGIAAAGRAALAGVAPEITVIDAASGVALAAARPALERPHLYGPSLDAILARAADLVAWVAHGLATEGAASRAQHESPAPASPAEGMTRPSLARHMARRIGVPLRQRLERLSGKRPEWRVGWRRESAGVLADGGAGEGWHWLPQGRDRFFADPFPLLRDGALHCFVEELPFATGKGVISHFTIGADGAPTTPRVVLEHDSHLSYPFLLEHGADVFMIPETSSAGNVELYRAEAFPDRWVKEKVLLDGGTWSDATLVEHEGLWWLFATEAGEFRSTWDALALFHARGPFGPFTPHRRNPVLIDAGAARPAGPMFRLDGRLIRPFQDCRAGYGAALGFARIDRLDPDGFRQTVLTRHAPPAEWLADGFHHLATAGGLEFVDRKSAR